MTRRLSALRKLSSKSTLRSQMLRTDSPEVPWDTFGVDLVIEATGQFRDRAPLKPTCMPAVHGCLHERSPQSLSTESSFLASANPVLILTTESFRRGRQPRCCRAFFRQSPKSQQSTALALLRFTRIQAISPYKITPVATTAGAVLPQKTSFPIPTRPEIGATFSRTLGGRVMTSTSTYPFSAEASDYRWRLVTTPSQLTP